MERVAAAALGVLTKCSVVILLEAELVQLAMDSSATSYAAFRLAYEPNDDVAEAVAGTTPFVLVVIGVATVGAIANGAAATASIDSDGEVVTAEHKSEEGEEEELDDEDEEEEEDGVVV